MRVTELLHKKYYLLVIILVAIIRVHSYLCCLVENTKNTHTLFILFISVVTVKDRDTFKPEKKKSLLWENRG